MIRRAAIIATSSAVALLASWAVDFVQCVITGCVEDDAARRASALLGPTMEVAYVVFLWISVFPAALLLRRWFPNFVAAASSAVGLGVVVAWIAHTPSVDGPFLRTLMYLMPWLVIPWTLGAFILVTLWPDTSDRVMRPNNKLQRTRGGSFGEQ